MLEVFILSLVQGITEFLPISSSSHLIIITKFLKLSIGSLLTDVSLHIGSFLAVLTYFHKDLINFSSNRKTLIFILFSSLPVLILGFFASKYGFIEIVRTLKIIGWTTVIFGILLYFSDKIKIKKKLGSDLNMSSSIIIGIFHALSIIPGVSRSGIAITVSRFLGFDRHDSLKISFLLSIPTLAAVTIFGFFKVYQANSVELMNINFFAILLSFLFSFITIKYFLIFVKKFSLSIFVIYRVIIGLLILTYAYF